MRRLMLGTMLAAAASGAVAQTTSGTAFAVAPELLVTSHHVVPACSSIEVISPDGRRRATVVVADSDSDLALLRASGLKGPTALLRGSRAVRLGEPAMTFGFPFAGALFSDGIFTSGLVNSPRGLRDPVGLLQISTPLQPGNSGGALLDESGLVIGVVQAKLDALQAAKSSGDIPLNVNRAVSLQVLADFLTRNNVAFGEGAVAAPLHTARVAETAQGFTYRVECHGGVQAAKPAPLPPCPGSYDPATWSHCIGAGSTQAGHRYAGEFRNGKRDGQGSYTWPSGEKYVGEFKDDEINGHGVRTFPSGERYVGEFVEGKIRGHGVYTFPSREKFVGEFRDNRLNGQGVNTLPGGEKYVGEFKDDKLNGQGTEYRADGSVLRSGVWENGVFIKSQ